MKDMVKGKKKSGHQMKQIGAVLTGDVDFDKKVDSETLRALRIAIVASMPLLIFALSYIVDLIGHGSSLSWGDWAIVSLIAMGSAAAAITGDELRMRSGKKWTLPSFVLWSAGWIAGLVVMTILLNRFFGVNMTLLEGFLLVICLFIVILLIALNAIGRMAPMLGSKKKR